MVIGIDARMYGYAQTGIGNYIRELIENILASDSVNEYIIFLREPEFSSFIVNHPRVRKIKVRSKWYTLSEQIIFPLHLRRFKIDLMHFPHFNAPILYRRKYILTIHDLTQKYFPISGIFSALRQKTYEIVMKHNLLKASSVICVSNYTKGDLIDNFPSFNSNKIKVIYEGLNQKFCHLASTATFSALSQKHKIQKPYLLYVGVLREHKNIIGLIKAFYLILKKYNPNLQLVITGNPDPHYPAIHKTINNLRLKNKIIQTGFIQDPIALSSLYQSAELLVLPSFREGFGFTPLEAMVCGIPVAVSNTTSLPEICGNAALYFNPYDIKDIAEKIYQLLSDQNLKQNLIQAGFEMVKHFSWKNCAAETLKIYQQAFDH